jgi:cytochrome c oxidase subunit 3
MSTHSDAHGDHGHLQHHFGSMPQQFGSSKLGMWLFIATEILMFGGLFVAYAVWRGNHPEIFGWGSQLLDRQLGATNTVVLITSSFTMALAVLSAQKGWRWRQVFFLVLTFLGACGFLGIKAMEYTPKIKNGLMWGKNFNPDPHYVAAHFGDGHHDGAVSHEPEEHVDVPRDLEQGKSIALQTCASCHGQDLRGMINNGKSLLTSEFIATKTDDDLLAFLKVGRQPWDPENTTGVAMPPRGGNPTLDDDKLKDVIAYLRVVQSDVSAAPPEIAEAGEGEAAGEAAAALVVHKSVIPPAFEGPGGLATEEHHAAGVPPPPKNAHHFFAIYFMMTGLHGIHVVAGMVVIGWLIVGALMGRYTGAWYTPVDLVGLFWHVVDLIWIFLFPLFYLI